MKQCKLLLILFANICWNFLLVPKGFCRIPSSMWCFWRERRWLVSKDTLSTGDSTTDNSTEYSGTQITEDKTKNKNQLLRWSCFSSSSETKTWMFRGRRWVMSSAVVTLWSVSLFIPPRVQFVKVVSGLEQMTRPGANNTEWKKKKQNSGWNGFLGLERWEYDVNIQKCGSKTSHNKEQGNDTPCCAV